MSDLRRDSLDAALREALEAGRRVRLGELAAAVPAVDVAEVLADWDLEGRLAVVRAAGARRAAAILEHLPYDVQAELLEALGRPVAAQVLREMSPDDLTNLLGDLEPEAAEPILTLLGPAQQAEIRELLEYPETSAGGIMTPDFLAVSADLTIAEVLAGLRRQAPAPETAYYLYAVEPDGNLAGVLTLRQIIVTDPARRVREVMARPVVSVPPELDQEEVARVLERYDLVAVPVVDAGRMLGVVTVDDVLDVLREEASEDLTRLGGSQPLTEPYLDTGVLAMVQKRFWWLLVLFLAESVTGTILRVYEHALERTIALAFFIPLLIATGGNAGAQASSLVIRGLAVGEIRPRHVFRVVGRELAVGLILGAPLAGAAFIRAVMLSGSALLGLTVALAVAVVVILATGSGALLPLLASRFRLDPAVVSAPLITTVIDGLGLLVYFWVAGLVLGW